MNDKIEEIRDRVEQDVAKGPANEAISRVHKDMAFLMAKVDHQRAENEKLRAENKRLRAGVEKLREALKPFAALFLWPDDSGEWTANDIRSDYDWDEKENDVNTDDVFIKRGHIRAARKALEGKP